MLFALKIVLNSMKGQKMPRLDDLRVTDYAEMLHMSTSRRYKYYEYLHAVRTADSNDQVT